MSVNYIKFHVVETSKTERYDVKEFVKNDPDDEKFLKVALAEASKGMVFILSVDDESLLELRNDTELYRRLCESFDIAKKSKFWRVWYEDRRPSC